MRISPIKDDSRIPILINGVWCISRTARFSSVMIWMLNLIQWDDDLIQNGTAQFKMAWSWFSVSCSQFVGYILMNTFQLSICHILQTDIAPKKKKKKDSILVNPNWFTDPNHFGLYIYISTNEKVGKRSLILLFFWAVLSWILDEYLSHPHYE